MSPHYYIFHTDGKRYIFHGPSCLIFNISAQQYDCLEKTAPEEEIAEAIRNIERSISRHKKKIQYDTEPFIFAPSCMVLNVSGKCNLACKYCFSQDRNGFKFKSMTVKECLDAISFMINSHQEEKNFTVCFFGGEPLLEKEVLQTVVEETDSAFPDKHISYSITTNGTIINSDFISFVKKYNISLLLSFDGPERVVNSYRPHKDKRISTYSATLKTSSLLKKHDVPFSFRATVVASDCNLMETIREFETHEIPYYLVPCFNSRNDNSAVYSEWDRSSMSRFLEEYEQSINFFISKIANKEPFHCYSFIGKLDAISDQLISRYSCGLGVSLFSVTSGGHVFSCMNMATRPEASIGDIYSGIDDFRRRHFLPFDIENQPKCQSCLIGHQCSGGCFSERYDATSLTVLDPDPGMCELKVSMWKIEVQAYQKIKNNYPYFLEDLPETLKIE